MPVELSRKDLLLAAGGLLTAACFVLAALFPVWPGDAAILAAVQDWRTPAGIALFQALTRLGWLPAAAALVALTTVLLGLRRRGAAAALLLLAALPMALAPLLKLPVGRPRPPYGDIESLTLSLSFPSGHASFAALFGGFLIYLVWQWRGGPPGLRYGLAGGLLLLIALMGFSRLYLGVHWPSDVVGGYLYGGVMLALAVRLRDGIWAYRAARSKPGKSFP